MVLDVSECARRSLDADLAAWSPADRDRGPGDGQLPEATLERMEQAYGRRFDDVEIHVDSAEVPVGQEALTRGRHIYFERGAFDPDSEHGEHVILQAIEAIYRVIKWVIDNAARIFTLIESIVNGAAMILAGNTSGVANLVETSLVRLMVPVIDFLADYLGLGGIPNAIKNVILGLQSKVEKILDRVIGFLVTKAKALWQAIKNRGKSKDGKDDKDKNDDKDKDAPGQDSSTQRVVKPFSMRGASHRLIIEMKASGLDVRMASVEGALAQKVQDEIETQNSIIRGLPPEDTELINYHTRARTALEGIITWYTGERVRINGLRVSKSPDEVTMMLRDMGEQLATRIIQVAAEFRLDDFVRRTFNVAQHLEAIRAQVVDQIEKHADNPNATGDGMAYTGAAAEMYLGWVEPRGRRHIDKVAVAMRVIDGALKELDLLTQNGVDMRGERWYVRGRNVLEMCKGAMYTPGDFLWKRGAAVVKAFIDDMDGRGLKGNGSAVAAAKRRLGMK